MSMPRVILRLSQAGYVRLARARALAAQLPEATYFPSYTQTVEWVLSMVPFDELEAAVAKQQADLLKSISVEQAPVDGHGDTAVDGLPGFTNQG